jgi:D-beta-D-heptose 7-phosphate kinase/D-beta-D-heptose 1-phosphate adenosyltransferase
MNNLKVSILVIGDIILDHYLSGTTSRISPEAPVPIVDFDNEKWVLGGAANVANNLASIGAEVTLAGVVGDDPSGRLVKNLMSSKNIIDLIFVSKNRKTTTKSRIISSNHQLLRIDKENRHFISDNEEREIFDRILINIEKYNCIIISDYSKGLLTNTFIKKIIEISKQNNIKVLVDPKTPPFSKYSGAYLIKPNRKEALLETGVDILDEKTLSIAAKKIHEVTLCEVIVITLSEGGVGVYEKENSKIIPTNAKDIFDVTGAGDTFIAVLAYSIAIGKTTIESCKLSNFASSVVVGKYGCVAIEYKEIESMI